MTQESSNPQIRSVTEPDRPPDIDRMDRQLREDIQPEQDIQPDAEALHPSKDNQTRDRSRSGTERVEQNAEDDVGEATEEA